MPSSLLQGSLATKKPFDHSSPLVVKASLVPDGVLYNKLPRTVNKFVSAGSQCCLYSQLTNGSTVDRLCFRGTSEVNAMYTLSCYNF